MFAFHSFFLLSLLKKRAQFLTRSSDSDKENLNRYYKNFDDSIFENRMNESASNIDINEIKIKNRDSRHEITKKVLQFHFLICIVFDVDI